MWILFQSPLDIATSFVNQLLHFEHSIEFLPTPFLHIPHRNLPEKKKIEICLVYSKTLKIFQVHLRASRCSRCSLSTNLLNWIAWKGSTKLVPEQRRLLANSLHPSPSTTRYQASQRPMPQIHYIHPYPQSDTKPLRGPCRWGPSWTAQPK